MQTAYAHNSDIGDRNYTDMADMARLILTFKMKVCLSGWFVGVVDFTLTQTACAHIYDIGDKNHKDMARLISHVQSVCIDIDCLLGHYDPRHFGAGDEAGLERRKVAK